MSLSMKVKFQSQNVTLENCKKRVISLILLEIKENHFKYPWDIFHSIQDYIRKKKNLQFLVLHYNHHVEHKMASYNLQQQQKIVVNLKTLLWPKKNKNKIKPYLTRLPIQKKKKKRGTHNFFVCEVFFFTLLRVKLYVLIKF